MAIEKTIMKAKHSRDSRRWQRKNKIAAHKQQPTSRADDCQFEFSEKEINDIFFLSLAIVDAQLVEENAIGLKIG